MLFMKQWRKFYRKACRLMTSRVSRKVSPSRRFSLSCKIQKKITKDDLKTFLSTPEMKKIIFDKVSVLLPESAKVEDFQKFMGSSAGKKIIQLIKGDIDAEDFNGSDMMDLVSYEFKYCETEDEECKPFSIKSFVIEQAQDYMPHGVDTKKAAEIFSSRKCKRCCRCLKTRSTSARMT